MNFIRLITQPPDHAFFNMALDEAISGAVRQRLSPPTLRLYRWDRPSLSIGYFQKISDIDTGYCDKKGYPVVRRQTGGRAILHDSELTYSFSASNNNQMFSGSLIENYTVISNALLSALKLKGIDPAVSLDRKRSNSLKNPACFKAVSFGEITLGGKKVIGSAQKRYPDGFLQQGSILISFHPGELCKTLGLSDSGAFNDIGAISDYSRDISFDDLTGALKEAFERTLDVKMISDNPTKLELTRAKELERDRYSTREWNYSR